SSQHPNLHVAVAGRGELAAVLAEQARELGLAGRLHLLGLRTDVANVLAAADVFVLPSLSEGLPLALLEAMCAARPIVASAVGEVPVALAAGAAGLLVEPGNATALAAALHRVLANRFEAQLLGKSAQARAAAEYGIARMVTRYAALYERLLCGRRAVVPRPAPVSPAGSAPAAPRRSPSGPRPPASPAAACARAAPPPRGSYRAAHSARDSASPRDAGTEQLPAGGIAPGDRAAIGRSRCRAPRARGTDPANGPWQGGRPTGSGASRAPRPGRPSTPSPARSSARSTPHDSRAANRATTPPGTAPRPRSPARRTPPGSARSRPSPPGSRTAARRRRRARPLPASPSQIRGQARVSTDPRRTGRYARPRRRLRWRRRSTSTPAAPRRTAHPPRGPRHESRGLAHACRSPAAPPPGRDTAPGAAARRAVAGRPGL